MALQSLGPEYKLRLSIGILLFYGMLIFIFAYVLLTAFSGAFVIHWIDPITMYLFSMIVFGGMYASATTFVGQRANELFADQISNFLLIKNNMHLLDDDKNWYNVLTREEAIDDQIALLQHWEEHNPFSLVGIKLNWEVFMSLATASLAQLVLLIGALGQE